MQASGHSLADCDVGAGSPLAALQLHRCLLLLSLSSAERTAQRHRPRAGASPAPSARQSSDEAGGPPLVRDSSGLMFPRHGALAPLPGSVMAAAPAEQLWEPQLQVRGGWHWWSMIRYWFGRAACHLQLREQRGRLSQHCVPHAMPVLEWRNTCLLVKMQRGTP